MNRIYLPTHFNADNRGCEGIAKGTALVTGKTIVAYSTDYNVDAKMKYANTELIDVNRHPIWEKICFKIKYALTSDMKKRHAVLCEHKFEHLFRTFQRGDVVLSTGGDIFCYQDNWEIFSLIECAYIRKYPTVLWGCSIGKENLTPDKIKTLKLFDAIIARESITAGMLKSELGLKEVYCGADPAFSLSSEPCDLPKWFEEGHMLGMNLSNFAGGNVGFDTTFGRNLLMLLDYLLDKTTYKIMLVPHVFWEGQDDRIICNIIFERYKDSQRVFVLDSEKLRYLQIRYIISKCSLFIGARTHAMISAYSECVPSLALGYSVKSLGIARDLGLGEQLVKNYKSLKSDTELVNAFLYLEQHEEDIRSHLKHVIPTYRKSGNVLNSVLAKIGGK